MKFKLILPLLAILGFAFATYTVVSSSKPTPVAQAVSEPTSAPFRSFIAGAGLTEAKSQNIAIGTSLSGLVLHVAVKVGDKVAAGDPLFDLDDRETRANLVVKQADLAKAQAGIVEAKAALNDSKTLNDLAQRVTDKRAISAEELLKRHNTLLINKTRLGSAEALVQQAEAELKSMQTTLDRLTVKAPVAGEVLQVNIRPGEYAQAGALSKPLLILGNLDQLHVRVDIDENDAWRFNKASKAVAFLRGNRQFKVELTLAYVEPFVVPKKSLTGDSNEQVDTRVLQALYSFDRKQLPIYVGQQMDVYIEAESSSTEAETKKATAKSGPSS